MVRSSFVSSNAVIRTATIGCLLWQFSASSIASETDVSIDAFAVACEMLESNNPTAMSRDSTLTERCRVAKDKRRAALAAATSKAVHKIAPSTDPVGYCAGKLQGAKGDLQSVHAQCVSELYASTKPQASAKRPDEICEVALTQWRGSEKDRLVEVDRCAQLKAKKVFDTQGSSTVSVASANVNVCLTRQPNPANSVSLFEQHAKCLIANAPSVPMQPAPNIRNIFLQQ